MVASQVKRAVGVFPNRQTAETALNELQGANFPMKQVSVIAKQAEGEELSGVDVSDRATAIQATSIYRNILQPNS
jgi:hypothetical protein